jgi:heptose I phosphotransferase
VCSSDLDSAEKLWNLDGEAVKKILKQRGTDRVFLKTPDGGLVETYIKRYSRIPAKEIIKQAFSGKFHTFDAVHEWNALRAFHRAELNTMVPVAVAAPGGGRSCNLTLGIDGYVKAEQLFKDFTPADGPRKKALIGKIAELAGKMHAAGFAHQDFYLVHMFVKENEDDNIYLIDLQRLIMQKKLHRRWRVKDLAQLFFAARPYVSETDIRRFWLIYCSCAGEQFLRDRALIKAVSAKAARITARDARKTGKKLP